MSKDVNQSDLDEIDTELRRYGGKMKREEAFLTVLAAAVFADNIEKQVEKQEFDALIGRTTTFSTMADAERQKLKDLVLPTVSNPATRMDFVDIACSSLLTAQAKPEGEGLCQSVFAHACDIIYADLEVVPSERDFLNRLWGMLRLNKDEARNIIRVITLKNKF